MRQRLELVFLEAQGRTGPVRRRTAHCLDDPSRKVGKVLRDTPAAAGRAVVEPGELGEAVPFVVDEILVFDTRTGLEHDDVDAFLRQLVAERAAAGTRADDDDHTVVVEIIRSCHGFLLKHGRSALCALQRRLLQRRPSNRRQSHSMSSKPRAI